MSLVGSVAAGTLAACSMHSDRLIAAFERLLQQQDSATRALSRWCETRGLAEDPTITATRLGGGMPPVAADITSLLGVDAGEALGFRHVRLACGNLVLSEARNWYVPARLPPEMNRELASTDRPFGAIIAPLSFRRERLGSSRGAGPGCPDSTILTNRAVIRAHDGQALAVVVECYQPGLLAPPGG